MIQLIKQAGEYFRLGEAEHTRKRARYWQERALAMELLYRYGELKVVYRVSDGLNGLNGLNCLNEQRLIAERFGDLDEGLVSRDRRAIREEIETEPKIRKWFQDLTTLSTWVRFNPERRCDSAAILDPHRK
jgi:hypothetical protein